MLKYHTYKESGIEWIGKIPEHWKIEKVRHNFNFGRGLSITKRDLRDNGVPCINYGEIHSKFGFSVDPEKHKLKKVDEDYLKTSLNSLLLKGDFVFADTSEDIEGSGNFSFLDSPRQTFAGYHTVILRRKNEIDYKFLAYFFDSTGFRNQIRSEVYGVKVFSITQAILKNTSFVIPPTESEQTQIANYLDRKTAEIDKLLFEKKALVQLYKEEKTAIINQAVTKGINPDAPMKDSGIEWLGKVPKHWEVKKLKYVAKMLSGNAFSSQDFCESGIQLIKISNLYNNHLSLDRQPTFLPLEYENKYQNWIVTNGDILMSMTGTLGKRDYGFAILINNTKNKFLLNQRVSKLHSYSDVISKLLLSILRSEYFLNNLFSKPSGTKQGNFSNEDVLNLKLAYPKSNTEQSQIVQHIEKESKRIDKKVSKAKKHIALLLEYRTALISEVVTGKIKITNEV